VTGTRAEPAVPPDRELVARCRAGDEAAWGELVERYSRYVYAIVVQGFRLAEHDAEDVFQDVFLRVYERLGGLRDDEAVRPWIAQVTRRLCLDRLASRSRSAVPAGDLDEDADEPGGEGELAGIEEAMDVHQALAALDPGCREMLDRFFARDEPYRVIAEAVGVPMGTVASRISRCLDKLRSALVNGRNPRPAGSGG
jgi:RNA polymerase sigma factor (sigma-70 family)